MEPELFSSGFLLFRKQNLLQFLLMKHPGRWDLPKGHLDPGETKEQAALRELCEETGLSQSDTWIDPDFQYESQYWVSYKRTGNRNQLKQLTIYLGFLAQDRLIVPTEHLGYAWFDWSPPHQIQLETIDPLLMKICQYFEQRPDWPGDGWKVSGSMKDTG
jgi:bis(5'-nucleosidyl)-tetraphosphatase